MDLVAWSLTTVKQQLTRRFILLILVLLLLLFILPLLIFSLNARQSMTLIDNYLISRNAYEEQYSAFDWQENLDRKIDMQFNEALLHEIEYQLELNTVEAQLYEDAAQGTGGCAGH